MEIPAIYWNSIGKFQFGYWNSIGKFHSNVTILSKSGLITRRATPVFPQKTSSVKAKSPIPNHHTSLRMRAKELFGRFAKMNFQIYPPQRTLQFRKKELPLQEISDTLKLMTRTIVPKRRFCASAMGTDIK